MHSGLSVESHSHEQPDG